jgi:hypothetical protein
LLQPYDIHGFAERFPRQLDEVRVMGEEKNLGFSG